MTDKYKDDLAAALGIPAKVTVRNIEVIVREVDMRGLREFAAACAPFLGAFNDPERLGVKLVDGKPATPDAFAFFTLVAEHSQAFVKAAALVTDAPTGWLERLQPDDFIIIADKIVEVNSRFFAHRLAPALIRLGASLTQHLGSGLSKFSSAQVIGLMTSADTLTASLSGSAPPLPSASLSIETSDSPT